MIDIADYREKAKFYPAHEKIALARRLENACDEIERLRAALANVMAWTCLQDDTVWYDEITTLHDHCEMAIKGGFIDEQTANRCAAWHMTGKQCVGKCMDPKDCNGDGYC